MEVTFNHTSEYLDFIHNTVMKNPSVYINDVNGEPRYNTDIIANEIYGVYYTTSGYVGLEGDGVVLLIGCLSDAATKNQTSLSQSKRVNNC